jgi:predicted amidophosphoribosyltransferase
VLLPPWLDRLLLQPKCPICCRRTADRSLCMSCRQRLQLDAAGVQGQYPLPWWALGLYQEGLRQQLLQLRRQANPRLLQAWGQQLAGQLPDLGVPLLITAIPARRPGGQPLPMQLAKVIAKCGGHQLLPALQRRRACLGQHHLSRAQRLSNLEGVFHCPQPAGPELRPLLLVDDILTTGATAMAAMTALESAGHALLGLACLARTPAPKRRG